MHDPSYMSCCPHHDLTVSTSKRRSLWIALGLICVLALVEIGVGWFSHSLALVAEAGHMLTDGFALGLALLATWVAQLPASNQATFGYRRVEILAALINGVGLIGVGLWIGWEAVHQLHSSHSDILSVPMLVTAVIGLGINTVNAGLLHQDSHQDLNLRGAFLHMVADAVSAVGVVLAALAIWAFHWNWADKAISLGVAIVITLGAIPLIRKSLHILLEKPAPHLNVAQIATHLSSFQGIDTVTNLRIWTIAIGQDALSAHLTVNLADGTARDHLLRQIELSLRQEFGIQEIFLQMTAPVLPPLINLSQPVTLDSLSESLAQRWVQPD